MAGCSTTARSTAPRCSPSWSASTPTWCAGSARNTNDYGRSEKPTIFGAANYLCTNGAGRGGKHLYQAIWRYNHADWYVRKVLAQAAKYATPTASGRGAVAVRAAMRRLGTPYSWGGGGTNGPSYGTAQGASTKGFDCSGLSQYAWAQAGVHIDRVAADQYDDGPNIPRSQLQPGDLVFFAHNPANPRTIHHVGINAGRGRMVHAPHTGDVVRVSQFTGVPSANANTPAPPAQRHL